MVIIMVAFAERYDCHQPRIARTAPARIGLLTDLMAERVDTEGAVLHDNHARYAGDEERAKRRRPATPRITDRCRQRERDGRADPVNVLMLPHHEPVFLEIANGGVLYLTCSPPRILWQISGQLRKHQTDSYQQ